MPGVTFFCISDTLVPTTYLVDTTLSNLSDSDQTVQAVRLLINYITGLIFCLSILIASAFLPVSIANFFGAPYEVGYLFSVFCLVLSLLYLWMRAKNKN
ncbi:hypothetical protein NGB51_20200 [Escherichia coli]|nr:hypothetical protein [Escherichia coli]